MTDNEIIKALEICTVGTFACGKECPYYSSKSNLKVSSCRFELMCEISDLINRQKEEIERLKHRKTELQIRNQELQHEKSEAIKAFAERLKCGVPQETGVIRCADVDNLVKEMTE